MSQKAMNAMYKEIKLCELSRGQRVLLSNAAEPRFIPGKAGDDVR